VWATANQTIAIRNQSAARKCITSPQQKENPNFGQITQQHEIGASWLAIDRLSTLQIVATLVDVVPSVTNQPMVALSTQSFCCWWHIQS